ncbi:MAG: carboxypeptidase regulatory-like domain-containing protein [Bacteroidaceae bacterium]|nr:carboxypeptidase regulatory-like domain-containing protein [Bacteroidaceae bacterium]
MRKCAFLFLFFAIVHVMAGAQTVIQGTVTDAQGKAVDAYVTVAPKGVQGIIGFADTDEKGHYRVEFRTDADSVAVTTAGLAIGQQVRVVPNRSQTLSFSVRQQEVELKEVTVLPDKIREHGDTLSYNVGSYTQQGDRVIGDVLKRMPGIEVSESGAIKFNGKSIKNFYVEDMDLLQGRYGLATNNINAADVTTVQVLQNHQPIKALQGKELSDDVAINLKLKDSAKGTVAVNTMLGGGVQQPGGAIGHNPLWTAEAVGMYFSGQRQNMTLYKGNNTGDDVSRELTQHYSSINSVGLSPFCPTGTVMPPTSGLPQKRTFDNRSHIATVNHLEKVGKDREVTMNVAYHHDLVRREGTMTSDRFVSGDQRLLTSETLTSHTTTNNLNVQGRYFYNAESGFMTDVLKFDAGWNSDDVEGLIGVSGEGLEVRAKAGAANNPNPSPLTPNPSSPPSGGVGGGSGEAIHQHFHRPQLSVSNTFNTIGTFGQNTLDLHFSVGYSERPNTLSVGVDSLLQGTSAAYEQDINSRHIAGNFHTNYNLRRGPFTMVYGIVANASLHGIATDLDGFAQPTGPVAQIVNSKLSNSKYLNDLWYNTYELTFGQSYTYERAGLRVRLGCPLTLYTQTLADHVRSDRHSYVHLLVTPTAGIRYEWRDWTGTVSTSYSRTVGDPGGIYAGYIMTNYRTFQRSYVEQLSETDRMGANAGLSYRNALTATFLNLTASYTHTRDNQTYGYDYHGATSVVEAVARPTAADGYSVGADFSKGFDWLQSSFRLFGGYSGSASEQLIGGIVWPFRSRSVSAGAGGTVTPLAWLNFVVSSGTSISYAATLSAGAEQTPQAVHSATGRLKMNVFITRRLTLTATAEDNYTNGRSSESHQACLDGLVATDEGKANLTETNRHAWFGDVSAKLKTKHVDWQLELNNLLNQQTYTQVHYSALDIYATTARLRPRNVILTARFKLL